MSEPPLLADVRHPGPRYREQGPCSGEEFRDDVLIPRVLESLARGRALRVELEDAEFGYPPGWLEEVFGGLVRRMPGVTPAQVTPVSVKHPDDAAEAIGYMREAALHGARSDAQTRQPLPVRDRTPEANAATRQETIPPERLAGVRLDQLPTECDACAAKRKAGNNAGETSTKTTR